MTSNEREKLEILDSLITSVSYLLDEYTQLYSVNEDQIDLLNLIAPAFFHHNQINMLNTITSQLCKLLDPSSTGGNSNLSLLVLGEIAQEYSWPCFNTINDDITSLRSSTEFTSLKRRRHKWLSHNGAQELINNSVEPINLDAIKSVLRQIQNIMNLYHVCQRDREVEFVPVSSEGASYLVEKLSDYYIYSKLKEERDDFSQDWTEQEMYKHQCFR